MPIATEKSLAQQVSEVFQNCLFLEHEINDGKMPESAILVEGVHGKFGFHPGRIERAREDVRRFLDEMPDTFHKSKGGGWSFLNLCVDKHGRQWGGQRTMSELICLGIACGMATCLVPRDMWGALPGGVPYVVFDTSKEWVSEEGP